MLGYLKKKSPERTDIFMKGSIAYLLWIKKNFLELQFWTPSDFNDENSIIVSYYDGEDVAPTFLYILDGLTVTKV